MIEAHMAPLKAITAPLDRSMPPEMITMAAPSANTPNSDVCRAISWAFCSGLLR